MTGTFPLQENVEQKFVVDLLVTLRADRFRPRAWGSFFQRSWLMSRQTACENPSLRRSWQRVTGLMTLFALLILVSNTLFAGLADTLRLFPGFVFCVAWQQSDLFWHLGLNRSVQRNTLLSTIGIANTLTWLRGLGVLSVWETQWWSNDIARSSFDHPSLRHCHRYS